jgi:hypothetical protein
MVRRSRLSKVAGIKPTQRLKKLTGAEIDEWATHVKRIDIVDVLFGSSDLIRRANLESRMTPAQRDALTDISERIYSGDISRKLALKMAVRKLKRC